MDSIADVLITGGWRQEWYGAPDYKNQPHCLVGAISCSIRDCEDRREYLAEFQHRYDVIQKLIGQRVIESWNDAPGRTFDEVLRIAKLADERLADEVTP